MVLTAAFVALEPHVTKTQSALDEAKVFLEKNKEEAERVEKQASVYSGEASDVSFRSSGSTTGFLARRSSLEKALCLIVLLSLIVVGILSAALINATNRSFHLLNSANETTKPEPSLSSEVCTTPGCVNAAAYLLASVDASVDPCDNFYLYACGKWNSENPIPEDKSRYGTFSMVRERLTTQMKGLLENDVRFTTAETVVNMTRLLYKSCMNTKKINEKKSYPVMKVLQSFGGWPLLNSSWSTDEFHLSRLLGSMKREFTADPLWQTYVYADAKNTSRNVLHLDQPSLSLFAREYYLNDTQYGELLSAYARFIKETALILARDAGIKVTSQKQFDQDILEILQFEKKLANLSTAQDERRNATALYNQWTLSQLKQKVNGIEWTLFLEMFLPEDVRPTIHDDTPIVVMEPEHIVGIVEMTSNTEPRIFDRPPSPRNALSIMGMVHLQFRVVANYLMWRLVKLMHRIMDERFQDVYQDFMKVMIGRQQKSPRWKECVQSTVSSLDMAAGAMYVEKYFNSKDKKEALDMISNLLSAFHDILADVTWMDSHTKTVAQEKVTGILSQIGYPDFAKNSTALQEYYTGLDIVSGMSYIDMVTKISTWHQEKLFADLLRPFDRNNFDISPALVNAFYSPEKNAIMFPAGILQPPFFRGDYPKAVNYGAMGAVIGHELTHGFDDQGSQYDADGNLNNWWSPAAAGGFRNRTRCIVDQYSAYRVDDINMNVNGKLTQGENIADNGGVKEAFKAYRKYIDNLGEEEPRLPGLDLTNDQVFFLSFASFWCGNRKPQAAIQQILTDSHSPEMFRVIGVMSNLDEFARVYQCKPGSQMNPLKSSITKCEVW